MVTIYTKEEADKLLKEIKDLITQGRSEQGVDIAGIREDIRAKFNELFSLYHAVNNKLDKLDQDLNQQIKIKSMTVKSPYANRPTH